MEETGLNDYWVDAELEEMLREHAPLVEIRAQNKGKTLRIRATSDITREIVEGYKLTISQSRLIHKEDTPNKSPRTMTVGYSEELAKVVEAFQILLPMIMSDDPIDFKNGLTKARKLLIPRIGW